MDKIEFRIWDKDDSYMLTYENYNTDEYFFQFDNFGKVEVYKANIPSSYPDEGIGYDKLTNIEYMRCTGVLDSNSKEIYEGDIVFDEDGEYSKTCIIIWDDELAGFLGRAIEDSDTYSMQEIDGEIIGNIYENPELLK